jgi:ubiquinone/menaquinone biosynthesis C-methylase UbiE
MKEHTTETRRAFDAAAPEYDIRYEELPGIRRMRALTSREYLRYFTPGNRLLELNCGTGNDAVFLALHGMRILATDVSGRMLDETKRKITREGVNRRVETKQLAFEELGELRGEIFDGAYSNLGGLNCSGDLDSVAADLGALVKPGGIFIAAVMPRFCLWETAAYLARLKWKEAFRRLAPGGSLADLHGGHVRTYYYSPAVFKNAFSAYFDQVKTFGMAIFTPPPNFERTYASLGRVLPALEKLDDLASALPPFSSLGDHYVIVLRRKAR